MCCLPPFCTASAPRIGIFRGSMAGLCAPLSTLRRNPRGQLRMTRGRCGSLVLHRKRLALSTPCRSPGASQMSSGLSWKADILRRGRHVSNVPTEVSRIDIINVGVEAFTSEGPSVENWQVFLASRASHSTTKPYQIARLTPIQRTTTCTFANVDVCFPQAGAGEQEGKTMTGSEAVSAKPSIIGWAGSTASPRCLRI